MPSLMILCPTTKDPVLTGLDMDEAAFAKTDLPKETLHCPRCGKTHEWTKDDAFFEQA